MNKNNYLIKLAVLTAAVVFVLDQITKYAIYANFTLYETKVVVPGIFNLFFAKNTGAAFSILADAAPWFRTPFFIIVPSIALVIIFILLKKSSSDPKISREKKMEVISFSLITGGALGNLIDRMHYGFVVDFLQIHYREHYWPSFNVADIAITVAIVLLFISMTLADRNKKRMNRDDSGKRV
jgi:signal peptidase II